MRFPKLYVAFIVDLSPLWVLSLVLHRHSRVQTGGPRLACPLPERHAQVFPQTSSDLVTFRCTSMKAPQGPQNKGPVALLSLPGTFPLSKEAPSPAFPTSHSPWLMPNAAASLPSLSASLLLVGYSPANPSPLSPQCLDRSPHRPGFRSPQIPHSP